MTEPELTLIEGAVLGLLVQQPRHGFALAKEFALESTIGSIFTARPPVVYRALHTLTAKDLVAGDQAESVAAGPRRVVKHATAAGSDRLNQWIDTPVRHTRDVRVEFLLKLGLFEMLGRDPQPFIRRQYETLRPIYEAHRDVAPAAAGFAQARAVWRNEHARAVMNFLRRISEDPE